MRIIISFILLFICFGVYAEDADTLNAGMQPSLHVAFDDVVVTATRTRVPVWRSPVPVSLIDAADIERAGGATLGDVLERSEPLTLRRYGAGAGLTTMSVRGIAADQTVVLLNGIQINSPQNGLVDLSTIPLQGIERVEIVRGGASSLYGNHAMGGVVNIITRSTVYDRPVVDIMAGGGSYGLRRINVQSGINTSAFDLSFGLGRDQADGDFRFIDEFNTNGSIRRENADYVQSFASLDGNARIDDETTLRLFARYSQTDRGLPGEFTGFQSEDRQEDDHLHAAVALSRMISEDVLVEFRPFMIYSELLYESPEWDYSSRSINRQYGASFDLTAAVVPGLSFTFGGEMSEAGIDADEFDGNVERVNTVAYLSGEWNAPALGSVRTTFYPSVRYDRFSNDQTGGERRLYEEITWKLGATVQPFAYERFIVRGSAGRNFKAPGLNDMYWIGSGNPGLVPERSTGYDAGIRWELPFARGVIIDAGLFSIRAQDRILWVPDPGTGLWGPVNLRKVHSDGLEFDLTWRPDDKPLRLGASYTYQDVRQFLTDDETGEEFTAQLIYAPYHLVSGEIGYDTGRFGVTLFPRYNGKRYTDEMNDEYVDGYFMFDIRAGYTVNVGTLSTMVGFDIRNVFDTDYQVVRNYPMPGRNYELSVRVRY